MKRFKLILVICFMFMPLFMCACSSEKEHKMGEWHIKSNATCTQPEKLERECLGCEYKETKNGRPALGHNYTTQTIAPTQTANGYTIFSCGCGYSYNGNFTCLLTFESISDNNSISAEELPKISSIVVNQNSEFSGAINTAKLYAKEYRVYYTNSLYNSIQVGQKIQNSQKITIVWETNESLSEDEINFNLLISKVKMLEDLSKEYNSSDYKIRAMQFIRSKRYNSATWNLFGGEPDEAFSEYVKQNEGSNDLFSLQEIETIKIPLTGVEVDFVHMIYTINAIIKNGLSTQSVADLCGWGGDICQLVVEAKNVHYSNLSGLQLEMDTRFNGTGSFGSADLQADLASINIAKLYLDNPDQLISSVISQYFKTTTNENQKEQFKINANLISYNSADEMAQAMVSRLSSNFAITTWCAQPQNNVNFTAQANHFLCACKAMAKYLL